MGMTEGSAENAVGKPSTEKPPENKADDEIKFEIPDWAGRPPSGYHLDVTKNDKLVQKLMIDEKRAYFFGRNPKQCDFIVDHASCSRVHAVLLFHKHLNRFFLVDLSSSHGTFIGATRLEPERPQCLDLSNTFHFGASTRRYVLRTKLGSRHSEGGRGSDSQGGSSYNLPEREEELENLTEYNTALNRRCASMPSDDVALKRKNRVGNRVTFDDDETVINPEDVDPSVGRFRNMLTTAIIPAKRTRLSSNELPFDLHSPPAAGRPATVHRPRTMAAPHGGTLTSFGPMSTTLGLAMPNPAPDIDLYPSTLPAPSVGRPLRGPEVQQRPAPDDVDEPRKKKYAKEAWPGRKPAPGAHSLV